MKLAARLEEYRVRSGEYRSPPGARFGAFELPGPCGERLAIIADDGHTTGWEHVSVSTRRRIPNWTEMAFVKDLFWAADECVVQFHPPKREYVNNYSVVLHMWRSLTHEFPLPPSILVGVKDVQLG